MIQNTPMTDASLAELDRLHAAAKMPARLYAITCPREAWEGINVYEVDTGGEPHWFALCLTRERAEYTEAALNAYPALRQRLTEAEARLAEVERERDELRGKAHIEEIAEAGHWIDIIRRLDPERLCDAFDDYGIEQYLQQWLADRDAQQRRKGAAEVWDIVAERSKLVGDAAGEKYAIDAAQRLREGK